MYFFVSENYDESERSRIISNNHFNQKYRLKSRIAFKSIIYWARWKWIISFTLGRPLAKNNSLRTMERFFFIYIYSQTLPPIFLFLSFLVSERFASFLTSRTSGVNLSRREGEEICCERRCAFVATRITNHIVSKLLLLVFSYFPWPLRSLSLSLSLSPRLLSLENHVSSKRR